MSAETRDDRRWMRRALRLGQSYVGHTAPNPAVGAVVVDRGNCEAGRGAHVKAGEPHAEVVALARAGRKAEGGTLYVTLEPCNHHGRTPPCTEAIVAAGIKRVVVGCVDPSAKVSGKGIERLRQASITVKVGVLQDQAERLIDDFRIWQQASRPFVIHKTAMTLDGATASHETGNERLTSPKSTRRVHDLRRRVDAVMVGAGTLRHDNPDLRPRYGKERNTKPWRIVVTGEVPLARGNLFDIEPETTWIVAGRDPNNLASGWESAGSRVDIFDAVQPSPAQILDRLYEVGVYRVLLEGGARLARSFLDDGLIDRHILIYSATMAGGRPDKTRYAGEPQRPLAAAIGINIDHIRRVGGDLWVEGSPAE